MKIHLTTHILRDSSRRIKNEKKRNDPKKAAYYLRGLFKKLITSDDYHGFEIKIFNKGYGIKEVVAGDHKFVYKKFGEDEYLLITYARKTDSDRSFGELLYLTKYYSGKKK